MEKKYNQLKIKKKILIVEDNFLNRQILVTLLEEEYDIFEAENGKEGLEILSQHYREISLILLDVYMPICTGFDFLEIKGKDPLLSNIPVIVTTGSNRTEDEVKCLRLGASDFVTKPYNMDVVYSRVHSVLKLKESEATLSAVEYDSLTGVYTMPAFQHHATNTIKMFPKKIFDFAVLDLKDFDTIIDIIGATEAEIILTQIAYSLRETIPESIIGRQNRRFYILIPEESRISEDVVEECYVNLTKNLIVSNLIVKAAVYRNIDKNVDIDTLCERVAIALISIMDDPSKRVAEYDEITQEIIIREQQLKLNLAEALNNEEFQIYYQPKIDTMTENIVGAEALVRWIKPDGTMISPGVFIPLYEKDGLIYQLDKYVFKKVCDFQKTRIEKGKNIVPISVNISRNSIFRNNTIREYAKIIEETGVNKEYVPLELTESASMEDSRIIKNIFALHKEGFFLHMDDFGTGYSSLSGLTNMPFSVIKFDRELINLIGSCKGNVLVRHTMGLAKELGFTLVAEGVETKEQVNFLREMNCDFIQGFYYYRPGNQFVFEELLNDFESKLEEDTNSKDLSFHYSINQNLQDQFSIIGGLSNAYFAVYKMDLRTEAYVAVKELDFIRDLRKNYTKANEAFYNVLKELVISEDQEKLLTFTNFKALGEKLKDRNAISMEFQGKMDDWKYCRANWIVSDRDEKGNVISVLYAVEEISDSIQERLLYEEKRQALIELNELRLRTMTEAIHGGFKISMNDPKFTFVMVSEQLADLLGYDSVDDFLLASGGSMAGIVHLEDVRREMPKALKDIEEGKMYTMHYRMRCKDGSWKNVEDRGRLIEISDSEENFWSFIVDQDELIQKSEALEAANKANVALEIAQHELKLARDEANKANDAKTTFLLNMSHDIRTPMNAILGYSQLIKKGLNDPTLLQYQKNLESASKYLLNLLNNVLDMAKVENGSLELDERYIHAGNIIRGVINVLDYHIKEKNLQVDYSCDIQHRHIYCDYVKLEEIFANLISNSIKYTPEGGKISIAVREIPDIRDGYVHFVTTIEDTGIGIAPDFLPHIFDSFSREKNTTSGKIAGTGLGMAIVKKYLDLMGGTIRVESQEGKGTKITISLSHRLADEEHFTRIESYLMENKQENTILEGKRILLVEDNEVNADIAVTILQEQGILVDHAADGKICLEKLKNAPSGTYDAILMDIQMPNMNGYEATRSIRALQDVSKAFIPIIAMTADAFEEDRKRAMEAGMNDHLTKPIEIDKLLNALRNNII